GFTEAVARPMGLSALTRRRLIACGAFTLALFLGLLCSFAVERTSRGDKVIRGVRLGDQTISGMSRSEVEALVSRYRKRLEKAPLTFSLGEEILEVAAFKVGVSVDDAATVDAALHLGSAGNWAKQFGFWLARLMSSQRLDFSLSLDRIALRKTLEPWAERHLDGPVSPS